MDISNGTASRDGLTLTTGQRDLLKSALQLGDRELSVTPAQRALLARICAEMERGSQPPEKLLVAFKAALISLADQSGLAHGAERERLIARLTSGFIEELYNVDLRSSTFGLGTADASTTMGARRLDIS